MYKTVRKGDASLQYTILPQTDQFTSSGLPLQTARKSRLKLVKYTMGTLLILFILSCIVTPFLINQNERDIFINSMLAMGRTPHQTHIRNSTKILTSEEANTNREMSLIVSKIISKLDASRERNVIEETSTQSEPSRSIERQDSDFTISDMNLATDRPPQISSTTFSTNFRKNLYSTLPLTSSSILTSSSVSSSSSSSISTSTSLSSSTYATTLLELKSLVTSVPQKSKMPRVTLKLRENETIPQMYMKAGIASYKKGNITTSVLARGLSLEGLIFKTPEGTIKPWPQKWPFEWMPSDPRWQGTGFTLPMLNTIFSILGVLVGLLCLSSLVLLFLLRLSRKKRPGSVEEPEVEGPEDKSTLLGTENQDSEEKE